MKITMYELLGLVKDGKAPKKIKYDCKIWEYNSEYEDYCIRNGDILEYDYILFEKLFSNDFISHFMNDEVEIIEKPKKIEKMECSVESWFSPSQADIEIIKKVNELIDEINNLKEK